MNVEYTGRQFEITPAIRKEVETGLNKLSKFLGETFKSKVILTAEKSRRIAEITIKRRNNPIVGLAESLDMSAAISQALGHIEKQALKHNGRKRDTKRVTKAKWKREAPDVELTMAVGATSTTAAAKLATRVHIRPNELRVAPWLVERLPRLPSNRCTT